MRIFLGEAGGCGAEEARRESCLAGACEALECACGLGAEHGRILPVNKAGIEVVQVYLIQLGVKYALRFAFEEMVVYCRRKLKLSF